MSSGNVSERHLRRARRAWYMYDWANSAFPTTVLTVLLGPYLTQIAHRAADAEGMLTVVGIRVDADAYYPFLVSLSVLLQLLLLPAIGVLADARGWKKPLLLFFAYFGALATVGLYWLEEERYWLGGALFVTANLCFGASMVMYNAFLPELAAPHERDAVSSRGWAVGYIGGGTLLGLNMLFLAFAEHWGFVLEHAVRLCLASAGFWWALFTLIPAVGLPHSPAVPRRPGTARHGWKELVRTLSSFRAYPQALLFLGAYFFYNDGVQTVIALSGQFASQELRLPLQTITGTLLMVQFVAFAGALGFGWLAQRVGTKRALLWSLVLWIGVLLYSGVGLRTASEFVAVAGVIALVLGGTQALSRSLFSQYIPSGREAGYFSFYELSERGSSWLGPFLFGAVLQWSGSYRWAIGVVTLLFLGGAFLLLLLRYPPPGRGEE
ncbi:MAG: MFS transporter [Candidatus Kapabacteria bacterium]|nr:MFS transporter [Candidatus Kapabacteria bacterium]MDW8224473.1 MFS transporter [Bacteroidota bacterium]